MERALKGEDLGKVVAETLFTLLVTSIGAQLARPLPVVIDHVNNVNSFLDSVINKIVEELRNEGIYLHPIEPVSLPTSPDVASLANGLKEALDRMDMAIGILKGLTDTSKEDC